MSIISKIRSKAKNVNKRIVLPEAGRDIRVIRAANILFENGIATPVLIGNKQKIRDLAVNHEVEVAEKIEILPANDPENEAQRTAFFKEKLAHKNPTKDQINELCEDPLYTAGWLLETGVADAVVAGSVASTAEVIRGALRTVGVAKDSSIVSSTFLMEMPDGQVFTYADCGVVPYPTSVQLASIALDSGKTHQLLTEDEPRIAFLSFSTKGSARHTRVDVVVEAYKTAREQNNTWKMDGELQFDTAFIPEIANRKAPDSPLKGEANVFIFPNLDAGNIAYKITERLAGAVATGPILQGLEKPYLDLSRGCSVDDIVNAVSVGAVLSTT